MLGGWEGNRRPSIADFSDLSTYSIMAHEREMSTLHVAPIDHGSGTLYLSLSLGVLPVTQPTMSEL